MQRKLAAILAADVAGYSRLIGADEVGTLRAFMADLREIVAPAISRHRGRQVKSSGDGLLAEFASAVDAVACAVDIQRSTMMRYAELPEDRRILFRIGINIGDIIAERGDIYGDGVNIAARLEALAEPGGICAAAAAVEQVRGKLPLQFEDGGERVLKNIAQPVHIHFLAPQLIRGLAEPMPPTTADARSLRPPPWAWAAGLAGAAALALALWFLPFGSGGPSRGSNPGPQLSLIVLPFANLSGDAAQDYIADVITEELTTSLARIPQAFVIARSTAFTYKNKAIDIKQLGAELGVRYALEGSAQPDGKRVRVNAQLIDTETGVHLWSEQFDAARTDLLQMQDEIVTRLTRALQFRLLAVHAARLSRIRPENADSEDLAMRCEAALLTSAGGDRMESGYQLCTQALDRDPQNVRALTNLAFKFVDRVLEVQSTDREQDIRKADELVSKALAIDPDAYAAHFAKAQVLLTQKQFEQAILEAEQSLVLNPSFVNAYSALCTASSFLGRPAEALSYADQAIRLSPHDPMLFVFEFHKGFAFLLGDQDQQSIPWLRRASAAAPEWPLPRAFLAAALALTGQQQAAAETLRDYLSLGATRARTIAQWRLQLPSDNPLFVAFADRLTDGLRKAGMPAS